MAAKAAKKATPAAEPKQGRPQVQSATFDDFQGEEVNVPDIQGWYSPEKGEAGWVGIVVGSFKKKQDDGKMSDVVVVRLLSECSSAVNDGEPVTLEPGHCMAVGIKAKLVGLLDYVEKHGRVAVRAKDKIPIGNNRSMWTFDIKGQPGARSRREDAQPAASAQPTGDDVPW